MITLYFTDLISASSVALFIQTFQNALSQNPEAESLRLFISSGGGEVDIAIELYNFLNDSGLKITTVNTSVVNSAAIIIYLAGSERICYRDSTFYVHCISKKLSGEYNCGSLKRELEEMEVNSRIVTSIMERHTKKSKGYWRKMMNKGKILTASESLKLGISTSV